MNITIIGTGYVGLVTGAALAALGHKVVCVGREKGKIEKINRGTPPFYEPGFGELLKNVQKKKLLSATDNLENAVLDADVIMIAVGTPTSNDRIDLSQVRTVTKQIGEALTKSKTYQVVVVKSTVVPTTTEKVVLPLLEKYSKKKAGRGFGLCMNPEFLREGNAVYDALNPDRIVIGQYDGESGLYFAKVFKGVKTTILFTNLQTAELVKYTANSLLATLISFSNEVARIADNIAGVDVMDVWKGVHLDGRFSPMVDGKRITPGMLSYVLSGCGYGGSCLPKDTKALFSFAEGLKVETPILAGVVTINTTQPARMIDLLRLVLSDLKGKRVALLGLAFKPNTDDIRESPALTLIHLLKNAGVIVVCHDPMAYKEREPLELQQLGVVLAETAQEALINADAAMLVTAWDEYKKLTPGLFKQTMKTPILIDGRRMYNKNFFKKEGIVYKGIGLREI